MFVDKSIKNARKNLHESFPYLHLDIKHTSQLINVGLATSTAQNALLSQWMQLANIPTQNFISGTEPRIRSYNSVILATNSKSRSTIEFIGAESSFPRRLSDAVVDADVVMVRRGGSILLADGKVLAVKTDGNCCPTFGVVDWETRLSVPRSDGCGG